MRDVTDQDQLKLLFKENERCRYDFEKSPLVRDRDIKTLMDTFGRKDKARWSFAQRSLMKWTQERRVFTQSFVDKGKFAFNKFFIHRGHLQGNILDIGGGWGLFRQWWNPSGSDFFLIHDPGVERFLRGPHTTHLNGYQKALNTLAIFVEGFGESLPYFDNMFDTVLISAVLDHCINPQQIIAEAYRCVRTGGSVIIIQAVFQSTTIGYIYEKISIIANALRSIQQIQHTHSFTTANIKLMIEQAGFSKVKVSPIPTLRNTFAFEAWKNQPQASV